MLHNFVSMKIITQILKAAYCLKFLSAAWSVALFSALRHRFIDSCVARCKEASWNPAIRPKKRIENLIFILFMVFIDDQSQFDSHQLQTDTTASISHRHSWSANHTVCCSICPKCEWSHTSRIPNQADEPPNCWQPSCHSPAHHTANRLSFWEQESKLGHFPISLKHQ